MWTESTSVLKSTVFGPGCLCCCCLGHTGVAAEEYPPHPRPPPSQLPTLALPPLCRRPPTFRVSHFSSLTSTRKKADKQAPQICEVSLNIYNYFVTVTSVSTQLLNNYYPTISPYYYILYYISIHYTIYYYITIVPDLSLLPPSLSSLPLVIFLEHLLHWEPQEWGAHA